MVVQNKSHVLFEFDTVGVDSGQVCPPHHHYIAPTTYQWLEEQYLKESDKDELSRLFRMKRVNGKKAIQFTGYVGVLRAPDGHQFEVLPKTGKASTHEPADKNAYETERKLLIKMLMSIPDFKHHKTPEALLKNQKMPLLEVFIQLFLNEVSAVLKRGVRSDYVANQDNLFVLRGKLMVAQHIKQNLVRKDRFFTEHDEFTPNRPENRLLHSALNRVLAITRSASNEKLAREYVFVFNEIPESKDYVQDFKKIRIDRGMEYYEPALHWAGLILNNTTPLTGLGNNQVLSLMFPMADLFEAYVFKQLHKQLKGYEVRKQVKSEYLVAHGNSHWFQLKPDILIKKDKQTWVLDTKWKLLDARKDNGKDKYDLSQSDFYQMYAYGQKYLKGAGELILIYPKTELFTEKLKQFVFQLSEEGNAQLKLWVMPFDLLADEKPEIDYLGLDTIERLSTIINPPPAAVNEVQVAA